LIRINAAAPTLGEHAKGWGWMSKDAFQDVHRPWYSGNAAKGRAPAKRIPQPAWRVREMRAVCGMSRKELARQSGISERYVAQIEAGKGNVSIILLLRIAYAIRSAQDDTA
jgi:DNA-binding XRE family transcriptional regulator